MFNKLIYSVLAVASIGAFSACNSTDSDGPQPSSEMKFEAAEMSRASLTTDASIKNSPFAVFGDMVSSSAAAGTAKTSVFNNTAVSHNGEKWVYDNPQYWFPGFTYSFVALHPANPASTIVSDLNYENSSLSFTYTYPADYNDALDILAATHSRRYTDNGDPVVFNFAHILSRLNFVAKIDPTATGSVTINSITLRGVGTKSTFSITPALPPSGSASSNDYIQATSDLWSTPSNEAIIFTNEDAIDLSNDGQTSHSYFPLDNPLMVIPQKLTEVNAEVVVSYTVKVPGQPDQPLEASSKLLSVVGVPMWLPGQSYTYNFTVGSEKFIIFASPDMQDWDESEGGNYIVGNTTTDEK